MRGLLSSLLATALVLLAGNGALAQQPSFDRLQGKPGRVIVFDASGSMKIESYSSRPRDRMSRARELFDVYVGSLAGRADPVPTAVHVFGSRLAWTEVARQYKDSRNYPHTGELCRDIVEAAPFATVDNALARALSRSMAGVEPRGMTPIHVALTRALEALDPVHGGEIVLISDLDVLNCLPPGQTVCEAIRPELDRFLNPSFAVNVTVFETPAAAVQQNLKDCVNVRSVAYDPDARAAREVVKKSAAASRLTVEAVYAGGLMDGVRADGVAVKVRPAGEQRLAYEGPPSQIALPEGRYAVEAELDGRRIGGGEVDLRGESRFEIPVAPPSLTVILRDLDGREVTGSANLRIADSRSGALAPVALRSGQTVELAAEEYELVAELADGRSGSASLRLRLGEKSRVEIALSGRSALPNGRIVQIEIRKSAPTLAAALAAAGLPAAFDPPLIVSGNGISHTVPAQGGQIVLPPGEYAVTVGRSAQPLAIQIPPAQFGGKVVRVAVEAAPGWFSASRGQTAGSMRLFDAASGKLVGEFQDAVAEHSLPEGRYRIDLVAAEGRAAVSREFEIVAGQRTAIAF